MTQTTVRINEDKILNTVMNTSKALIDAIKFEMDYAVFVPKKQEKKTSSALKQHRKEEWARCMHKAKNNKSLAYKYYTAEADKLFS